MNLTCVVIYCVHSVCKEINLCTDLVCYYTGEDALSDVVDASDMNSIAGVLKLYFRELREPLFPLHLFDALVECTSKLFLSLFSCISVYLFV